MLRQRTTRRILAAAAVIAAAGCSDSTQPTVPDDQSPDPSFRGAQQGGPQDPNGLARGVRGFGGFFFDAQGTPTIHLKHAEERGNAERALAPYLRAQGLSPTAIRVLKGDFDWAELERWHEQAAVEALAVTGTVFADADEAANRVRIGIERGASAGEVRAVLRRLGIPDAAAIVEETEPVVQLATLRDRVRPTVGGLQINFPGFLCTLGFNARDGTQNSFITNSHCTSTQGGVESTPYWQPTEALSQGQIATEVEDPTYRRNIPGCPRGRRCRFSDASRAAYVTGTDFSGLGRIAQTTGANNNSLTISSTNPSFLITGEGGAAAGIVVNKIGRTTGWTRGSVTNTCVTTSVSGTNIAQICQTFVSAGVGAGDSGSPVFIDLGGNNATLVGILWGGSGSSTFVFSPISNVEQELGALTTF